MDTKKNQPEFEWTQFYQAVADKLREYQNNRTELLNAILEHSNPKFNYLRQDKFPDGSTGPLEDICPFTVLGTFNRLHLDDQAKQKTASDVARILNVNLPAPYIFYGIVLTGVNWTRNSIRILLPMSTNGGKVMGRKKGISAEQRRRWALSAVRREDSMVSLSREAGVTEQTLYRWRDLFIEGGCERLNGGVSPEREEIERLKKELAERDQVIGEQTIAIRVLKKNLGV